MNHQFEDFDSPRHKCGIFGIYNHPKASSKALMGLHALQHRGEESAGIVVSDGRRLLPHRKMGMVKDLDVSTIENMTGNSAIGHVRYSTTGSSHFSNAQPLLAKYVGGQIAVAHNGNLTNSKQLHDLLERQGCIFQSTCDSESIIHLLASPEYREIPNKLEVCLGLLRGAFAFVIITPDALFAARDYYGYKPLSLGKLGESYVVASETTAFDLVGAIYERDIRPGEVLRIDAKGPSTSWIQAPKPDKTAYCIFEHVYFARPDSKVFGSLVYDSRMNSGRILAQEAPVEADIVVPVPDSGIVAGLGFAKESGIPFEMGFIRNHYIGRTFILPNQEDREQKIKLKINVVADVVRGKRVVVIDDSIIRGNTTRSRIKILKEAGAKEVHMRIACPPTRFPCYYGIDFPDPKELIANNYSIEDMAKEVGADSLAYLSPKGLLTALGGTKRDFCMACFTGNYAAKPEEEVLKNRLECNT